jgi:hypothetical protein
MLTEKEGFEKAQFIVSLNEKVEESFGGLKHSNFSLYLDKVSQMHIDSGLVASIIIVRGIHEKKRELIEGILKEKAFKINTQIRVFFSNGEELAAQYVKKLPEKE